MNWFDGTERDDGLNFFRGLINAFVFTAGFWLLIWAAWSEFGSL